MSIQVNHPMPPSRGVSNLEKRPYKRAIALISYDRKDYFEKVLDSISSQSICGTPIFDQYDFYVFQDGLSDPNNPNKNEHTAITELATKNPYVKEFFLQDQNLGITKHFAFAEDYLFNQLEYDFVVFCEDDMVLGDAYMASLHAMAEKFIDDERIAMVSAHSMSYIKPMDQQLSALDKYLPMGHSWGYGLYRRAWKSIEPILKIYIDLLDGVPKGERNDIAIQFWLQACGFKPDATSHDFIKSCAIVALGYLRISSYPNYGLYIGERGVHFNPESFQKHRYVDTIICNKPIADAAPIDENQYHQLWKSMANQCLSKPNEFSVEGFRSLVSKGLPKPNLPANLLTSMATAEDIIALYKLFFNRYPENQLQIDTRLGMPMHQLLIHCLDSEEFFNRHQYWPAIVRLAKKIMEKYESEIKKPEGGAKN